MNLEENRSLRRRARIFNKIEQQLQEGGSQSKKHSDRVDIIQPSSEPPMSSSTSPADELSITVTKSLAQINYEMSKQILNFQRFLVEQLAVIKKAFDATFVEIHQKPRLTKSLETTTTSATDTASNLLCNATFTGSTTTI